VKSGYGNRIREIREKNGLNRCEFGEKLGLTYDQVLKIESENRKPSDETKVKICEEFKVSADYILMGSEFIMPRTPVGLNMNMQTIMAKEAINHLDNCAKSIKKLDVEVVVGLERLREMEDKVVELDIDPELKDAMLMVKMEGRIAN